MNFGARGQAPDLNPPDEFLSGDVFVPFSPSIT
jgi:hypothetical protein